MRLRSSRSFAALEKLERPEVQVGVRGGWGSFMWVQHSVGAPSASQTLQSIQSSDTHFTPPHLPTCWYVGC